MHVVYILEYYTHSVTRPINRTIVYHKIYIQTKCVHFISYIMQRSYDADELISYFIADNVDNQTITHNQS